MNLGKLYVDHILRWLKLNNYYFINKADLVDNGDNAFDQNDFVELASIEGSESVATGNLSRANTDLN